jgi:Protein of unknown function (DUF1295)
MAWVWTVSLPVTILNSPAVSAAHPQPRFGTGCDIAGLLLWAAGFGLESVGDAQRYAFKSTVQQADKSAICDKGLWRWSRHPNYFGEVMLQFGIWILALSPSAYRYIPPGAGAYRAQYASILGPVFLTVLLLFVSGLPLQERPAAKRRYDAAAAAGFEGSEGEAWDRYQGYLKRTSILLPLPPALYEKIPVWVKRTVLLELPIYVFDPAKHAHGAPVQKKTKTKKSPEANAEEGRSRSESGQGLVDAR